MQQEIKKWLEENKNEKFAKFAASLIPNLRQKIYGVKLPCLRKKAKELGEFIDKIQDDSIEEILLQAYAIGEIKDINLQIKHCKKFISKIDNWEVCDSFVSSLKSAKIYQEKWWNIITNYAQSQQDYEQRFGYVMMLRYFCNDEYIDRVLSLLAKAKAKVSDVSQAVAWAYCECYIKYKEKTAQELKKVPPEVLKLTRRKILDSKRVSELLKHKIKNGNL